MRPLHAVQTSATTTTTTAVRRRARDRPGMGRLPEWWRESAAREGPPRSPTDDGLPRIVFACLVASHPV